MPTSAEPTFRHTRETIDAHLISVFCALAVSRHLQTVAGLSLRKILTTRKPLREGLIEINGTIATTPPPSPRSQARPQRTGEAFRAPAMSQVGERPHRSGKEPGTGRGR